jgi:hypothetical protein
VTLVQHVDVYWILYKSMESADLAMGWRSIAGAYRLDKGGQVYLDNTSSLLRTMCPLRRVTRRCSPSIARPSIVFSPHAKGHQPISVCSSNDLIAVM